MSDVLKMINELEDRLFASYGDPLATYKKTQHDIHMTYYVGKLMEVRGHKDVLLKVDGKDTTYYSEKALQEAFLAGQRTGAVDRKKMREDIIEEVKAEMREALDMLGKDREGYYC
jgi:hypothetical protein